jgi:hypothetical protein
LSQRYIRLKPTMRVWEQDKEGGTAAEQRQAVRDANIVDRHR